jgi:hypothetical protein
MIDTNKYEGHTKGPWSIKTGNASHSVKDANSDHVCTIPPDSIGMCNKHIIADAPLLLAEVKRLRDELEWWKDSALEQTKLEDEGRAKLYAEVRRLRKEINQLPIDLHESLDMILEAHHPEVRESVMAMFGDAWGNNLTGYEE